MEYIYEFILNNQLPLLIVAAILAMALIGYVAEEYGFYKKNATNKKLDTELEDVVNDSPTIDQIEIPEISRDKILNDQFDTNYETEKYDYENHQDSQKARENLNIDKDFGKLLDDEEDIMVGGENETTLDDIDEELWKF